MHGSKWGTSSAPGDQALSKIELKPSLQEQIVITKDWWYGINPNRDLTLPIGTIKKFFVQQHFSLDLESAEKEIIKYHGRVEEIGYDQFYKMFCKGIFRVALQDLLQTIYTLSKGKEELPMILKLGSYRRSLMLCGLDKQDSELKDKGKSILYAMKIYKEEIQP